MLRVIFSVDVAESVRRGKPSGAEAIIELHESDLSQLSTEDREALANSLEREPYNSKVDRRVSGANAPEPTLTGLMEAIHRLRSEAEAEATEKQQHQQAAQAILDNCSIDQIATAFDESNGSWYSTAVKLTGINGEPSHTLEKLLREHPDREAITAKYDARRDAEEAAAEDARKKREQEDYEKRLAEAEEREQWIAAHGSPRLKRLLAEEIEYKAVYRDERLALERPSWCWYDEVSGYTDDPRNPPEDAFKTLDEARKVDPEARLMHYTVEHEHDEDCYGDDCPKYDVSTYVAESKFLGRTVIFGL